MPKAQLGFFVLKTLGNKIGWDENERCADEHPFKNSSLD